MNQLNRWYPVKKIPTAKYKLISNLTNRVTSLSRITSLDIFRSSSAEFNEDGLFSTEIFGLVGSDQRNKTYAYIDFNTYIITPKIYKMLMEVGLYKDIVNGRKYATFDSKTKNFVIATKDTGDTGIHFFYTHVKNLVPEDTGSSTRLLLIRNLEKYRDTSLMVSKVLVIPAGFREYILDKSTGRAVDNEFNDSYRSIIKISSLVPTKQSLVNSQFNKTILSLQERVLDLHNLAGSIGYGKHGFIKAKFASRNIMHSTRNISITSPVKVKFFNDVSNVDEHVIGLPQYMKMYEPLITYEVKKLPLFNKVFAGNGESILVVDKKTLTVRESTTDESITYSKMFSTTDGIIKVIDKYLSEDIRLRPIQTENSYLYTVEDVNDVITLKRAEDGDVSTGLRPLTYTDLFVMAVFGTEDKVSMTTTRHPVDNVASTQIAIPRLQVSTSTRVVTIVRADGSTETIDGYPVLDKGRVEFVNGVAVNFAAYDGYGLDNDGDGLSSIGHMSVEATTQAKEILDSDGYYITVDNKLKFPPADLISNMVVGHLTAV